LNTEKRTRTMMQTWERKSLRICLRAKYSGKIKTEREKGKKRQLEKSTKTQKKEERMRTGGENSTGKRGNQN